MTPDDEQVARVAWVLRGGTQTMHHLTGLHAGAAWPVLDMLLRQPGRRTDDADPFATDARLLLWLGGLTRAHLDEDPSRRALLDRVLSSGLRNNAFEFVLGRCESLGFADPFGAIDPAEPGRELDLRMKHVRLLKRRGAYADALGVLGKIAGPLAVRGAGPARELDVAALLYSVAKSLGSHQNRSGQSALLCDAAAGRILRALRRAGVRRREFRSGALDALPASTGHRAQQLWAKTADYGARQRIALAVEHGTPAPQALAAVLPQWDDAIAFDERHGIRGGRSRFARQAAIFEAAGSPDERLAALRGFERLLLDLAGAPRPDRRGVAIRTAQAAQMCLDAGLHDKAAEHVEMALEAAQDAADWPALARALLIGAALAVASRGTGAARWAEALYRLQRAGEAIARLREPPLPLLFDHCVAEARIALATGDHTLARERIAQAIDHVGRMRHALLQEDWSGARAGTPDWLRGVAPLLTPRERATMQGRLVADWHRLLQAQEALVEMLRSAHEIENYLGVVAISAARETLVRSGLAHDLANVVSQRMTALLHEHGGAPAVPVADVVLAKQQIEDEIRRHVISGVDAGLSPTALPGRFVPVSKLLVVDTRQLELLRVFAPALPPPELQLGEDFELRCDEKLFRILFFQLLENAAQELASSAQPRIAIRAGWSAADGAGRIEVIDGAGRVEQLLAATRRLQDTQPHAEGSRGWGLREALRFFADAFRSPPPQVLGQEGVETVLRLHFRPGRNVNRLAVARRDDTPGEGP